MNKDLVRITAEILPTFPKGRGLTYNPEKNVYLTLGYTSAAGNTYFKALRASSRLVVVYHIGKGYIHTFLNGITLLCWNGQEANIIAQKSWGGNKWKSFSEQFAKEQSILMLKDYLTDQVQKLGQQACNSKILSLSREMIEETQFKKLA